MLTEAQSLSSLLYNVFTSSFKKLHIVIHWRFFRHASSSPRPCTSVIGSLSSPYINSIARSLSFLLWYHQQHSPFNATASLSLFLSYTNNSISSSMLQHHCHFLLRYHQQQHCPSCYKRHVTFLPLPQQQHFPRHANHIIVAFFNQKS